MFLHHVNSIICCIKKFSKHYRRGLLQNHFKRLEDYGVKESFKKRKKMRVNNFHFKVFRFTRGPQRLISGTELISEN